MDEIKTYKMVRLGIVRIPLLMYVEKKAFVENMLHGAVVLSGYDDYAADERVIKLHHPAFELIREGSDPPTYILCVDITDPKAVRVTAAPLEAQ